MPFPAVAFMNSDTFKEISPPTWGLTAEIHTTAPLQHTKLYQYITVQRGGFGKVFFQKKKPDSTAEERKEHSTHEDLSSNVAASAGLW